MNELKLHDIKPLVEIPDISLYLLIAICLVGLIILATLAVILYQYFKNRAPNLRKLYYKELQELDLDETKNAAYIMTKNLRELIHNEREKKLIEEFIAELEPYKYKKEVEPFPKRIKDQFERVMDAIDL